MSFRNFTVACLVIAILGSGCSRTDSRTIRLSSWGDEKENAILSSLIADFEKSHPDIPVKLLRVPYTEYMPKLFSQIAAGNAPDVIFVSSDDVMTLSVKGTLEPLDDYVKSASGFPIKDFYPYALQDYTVNGHLYVMPRDIDPHYDVYYNKKAFDEVHLRYPKDDWTMDEFLKDAKALVKKDANGNVTRWGFTDDVVRIEPWVLSSGGWWVDNPLQPTKYTFNEPKFIRGIQERADLLLKYKVSPTPASMRAMGGLGTSDLFLTGAVGMFFSGMWHVPQFRDIKDFDWDMAPFPKGPDGKRAFLMGGSGYGILQASKNKKGAWELVKYIAGPEGEKLMSMTGLVVPALKNVAESPAFLDKQKPLNKKMILKFLKYGVARPRTVNWTEISDGIATPALDRVWLGEVSAQEAVSQLYEKLKTVPLLLK